MGYVQKDYAAPAELYVTPEEVDEGYRASIARLFDQVNPEPTWVFEFAEGHPGRVAG